MKSKLPQTESIQELATFWDNHDITDFEDELIEVTEPVFESSAFDRRLDNVLEIHLQSQEVQQIEKVAALKGISQETLLRQWILDRLGSLAS